MSKKTSDENVIIDYALLLARKFYFFLNAGNNSADEPVWKESFGNFTVSSHTWLDFRKAIRSFTFMSKKMDSEEKKLILLLFGVCLYQRNGILLWKAANFFHKTPAKCLGFINHILDAKKPLITKKIVLLEEIDFSRVELNLENISNYYNLRKIYLSPIALTSLFSTMTGSELYAFPTVSISPHIKSVDELLGDIANIVKYLFFISNFFKVMYSPKWTIEQDIYEIGDFAQNLHRFQQRIANSELSMELTSFLRDNELSRIEFIFLLFIIYKVILVKETVFNSVEEILTVLAFTPSHLKSVLKCFSQDSVFVKEGFIESNDFLTAPFSDEETEEELDEMLDREIYDDYDYGYAGINISRERIYQLIFNEAREEKDKTKGKQEKSAASKEFDLNGDRQKVKGLYEIITPRVKIDSVILDEDVKKNLLGAVDMTKTINIMKEWGIKPSLSSHSYGSIKILLHGPSGTGKTITAEALAGEADADLFKVDATNLVTSWVGESAKNVRRVFKEFYKVSKECNKRIFMFFNEADQLLSARGTIMQAADKEYNQMQNLLLEELENFDGVFLATTNLIDLLDSAWNRRFNIKIKFDIPTFETRLRLWQVHISDKLPMAPDVDLRKLAEIELAGGGIANVVYNAARKAALRDGKHRMVTQKDFLDAIKHEMSAHMGGNHNKVGFSS